MNAGLGATEVPVTVTPVPTSTPAPKVIGVKTSQAKYIYMTNGLQDDLREIYLMTSGGDDWGKNLIPAEASVKASILGFERAPEHRCSACHI